MPCHQPFRRVLVDRTTNFGVRVWWEIQPEFFDRQPHVFQLQHSYSGLTTALDWTNVGEPAVDATMLTDDLPREQGKTLLSHYRIKLATPDGKYVSESAGCRSAMGRRMWLMTREIVREEILRFKRARTGVLFKRRRYGERCPRNDPLTGEVQDSDCSICLGTGYIGGYHKPFHCLPFEIPQETISEKSLATTGTSRNDALQARTLATPMLQRLDVLADANTDERFHIQDVTILAAVGNLPIVLGLTLLPLPFSHVVYTLPTD